MKKICSLGWTGYTWSLMVCTLYFFLVASVAGEEHKGSDESAVKLRETEMARQAAEQKCAELSLTLVQTERELEKQRQRYAELLVKAKKVQEELDAMQARAAVLLLDQAKAGDGKSVAEVLAGLENRQAEVQKLTQGVREFGKYVQTVLDAAGASSALKQDVQTKFAGLIRTCNRLDALPPLVAGRGGDINVPRECRVLSVGRELGVVVLDAGSSSGVRTGSLWRIMDGEKVLARLRVVEVRPGLSAAVPVEGQLSALAPGMPVRSGE